MRFSLILRNLAFLVCSGCVASEPRVDAAEPGERNDSASDAGSLDAAEEVAPPAQVPANAEAGAAPPDARAGEAGVSLDTGNVPAPDAATSDAASAACDDDHPCSATDTVCVERVCRPDPEAPASSWQRSPWSGRVGLVGDDDSTLWCTPSLVAGPRDANNPARVTSHFQRASLAGSLAHEVTAAQAAQRVRFQCFADAALTGASSLVTSAWSVDARKDAVQAQCPRERPHAGFLHCQIAAQDKPPFVYAGPTCGDGVAGLSAKASVRGQLVGDHYELTTPAKPLFNNTGSVAVMGTDLGFQFLAQGRMYLGFGDTWENELQVPGANGYRGSVLAYTRDFEPADENGIAIAGWDTSAERPNVAREVIPSPHDQSGNSEFTAIGTAGFGLSEGDAHYRFLWFAAIKTWEPFTNNESSLAWSKDGGTFVRGDQAADVHAPRWPFESYFGPGATWVDRERGYVYFFGVRTYQAGYPIRLARVRATLASVLDHRQYEYWTGSGFQRPDEGDEYALVRLADRAADLVPGSSTQNNRPELSVAYNPYVGRFIMLIQNDATPFSDEAQTQLQLWEAEQPEGPWRLANTGEHLVLPPHHYGPYTSEQLFSEGGRDVHFALSEWNLLPLILGQPYVVGLWSMKLERRVRAGCAP
jgi:hypothetical protein